MKKPKKNKKLTDNHDTYSMLAYELKKESSQIIAVTSIQAHQGKSFFIYRLAEVLAQYDSSVLIINANSQAPDVCERAGLYDIDMSDGSDISPADFSYETNEQNIRIMPFGRCKNINKSKAEFEKISDILKEKFDFILIEVPDLEYIVPSMNIVEYADKCLILIRSEILSISDETKIDKIQRQIDFLPCRNKEFVLNSSSEDLNSEESDIYIEDTD